MTLPESLQYAQIIVTLGVGLLAFLLQRGILKVHRENLKANLFDKRFKICETIRLVIATALNIRREDNMSIFIPFYQTLDESVFLFESDATDFIERVKEAVGDYYVSVKNSDPNNNKSPQERCEALTKSDQLAPVLSNMMEERIRVFDRYLKPLK